MFGEWGYPDNPGLSRIIQILDNPGYVWIYPDNTRLRNGGGGGGRGGAAQTRNIESSYRRMGGMSCWSPGVLLNVDSTCLQRLF